MLDAAVVFLAEEFNAHLLRRMGSASSCRMKPGPLVDDGGKLAIEEGTIGLVLINIEEERTTRAQLPERVSIEGQEVILPPEIRLNLTLMAAANMGSYNLTLKALSQVLIFFQAHPVFAATDYPSLDGQIGKLCVDMQSVSHETLNQIWATLGAKYLPSVLYRVRLITLQDQEPQHIGKPISSLSVETYKK
jgi:hypothetical protein